jgi:5-methylcytosine-specific restriction endonuclease McrA
MSESITFTVPKTKTATKALLVAERKAMREKQKQSAFMRKTLNIYNGMTRRSQEMCDWKVLPFTLESFRSWLHGELQSGRGCCYCGDRLTIAKLAIDHSYPVGRDDVGLEGWYLENLRAVCRPCNWQKGILDIEQFKELLLWIDEHLNKPEATDLKRRLTIGGKWSFKS